jgi:hypothetical protein
MSSFILLLAASLSQAEGAAEKPLRYLRQAGDQFVLESEVTRTRTDNGTIYVSRTERPAEKMTLTLHLDRNGKLTKAEAVQETEQGRKAVGVELRGGAALVKRAGGITDRLQVGDQPVVTTAPDWSDIFEVLRRYDVKKGGRQEFAGLWVHPVQPPRLLTFTVEQIGSDAVAGKDGKVTLGRYRVKLRSGDYLVWADAGGRVCRLQPAGKAAAAVVLEGFQEATRGLK